MRCNSIQRKLSTWSNSDHSAWEARRVEAHLAECGVCRAYRDEVQRMDSIAATLADEKLHRDLLVGMAPVQKTLTAPPARPFAARQWAPLVGIAAMLLGVWLNASRRDANSAAAAAVKHMDAALVEWAGYHERLFQAEGAHQEGELTLISETWYERARNSWRITSPPDQGGDRIIRDTGDPHTALQPTLEWVQKGPDGRLLHAIEVAPQRTDPTLADFLAKNGLLDAAANAQDLGRTALSGTPAEEISIPTYDTQRTYVWLMEGTDVPLRIERQNLQNGVWHTSWLFTIAVAERWPDSVFDPATLRPSGGIWSDGQGTGHAAVAAMTLAKRQPAWKTGNVVFGGYLWRIPSDVPKACLTSDAFKAVDAWMSQKVARMGPLEEFGSVGPNISAPGTDTTQAFHLTFEHGRATAMLSFHKDADGIWKVTGISDAKS